MRHEHFDFDGWQRLVEELLRGKVRRWLEILRCRVCRKRLRRLLALPSPEPESSAASFESARQRFRAELHRASEDATRAEGVLEKFLEASDLQRRFWLENSSLRGNLSLCQKVLQRAEEQVTHSAGAGAAGAPRQEPAPGHEGGGAACRSTS